ncbi:hypothetical protein C8Q77DRAFT_1045891 [Trametes polyzona]|nr:hypothetical protein C8Q77DRAFT_1045891 [Trametes polyzona]
MSPVLSARARRETPNPGQGAFAANLPRTSKHLVRRCKMKGAKPVVFEEPQVNQDDVLANKLPMDADTHRNVLELIAAVPALAKKQTESKPQEVKDFLRCDSPPPDLPELEILPLFPRSQRPYPGPGAEGPSSMPFTSMSKPPQSILSPVAMKDLEEDDLAEEHLVVVNGWQALRTSSPSTPSLADSTSEVDELFMPSSPGSELFCVDKLQMEEHQMPRSERIGGAHGKAPLPGEQHNEDSITFAVTAVERACGDRIGNEDPTLFILQEKLDEKDSMLMDVPFLRPPHEHPVSGLVLPAQLGDLLASAKSTEASVRPKTHFPGSLKKAKGVGPLQIELSWIPFKYGPTVPTDEDVADVENDPCPQLTRGIDLAQEEIVSRLAALLDDSMAFGSQPVSATNAPSSHAWLSDGYDLTDADRYVGMEDEQILILPRQDRRRLAGLPPTTEDRQAIDDDEEVGGTNERGSDGTASGSSQCPGDPYGTSDSGERLAKKVRFQSPVHSEMLHAGDKIGWFGAHDFADDSGFFEGECNSDCDILPGGTKQPLFGQLASDCEGFDGPNADGDLFPDVHPIHSGDYGPNRVPASHLQDFVSPYGLDTGFPSQLPSDHDFLDDNDGTREEELGRTATDLRVHQSVTHDARPCVSSTLTAIPVPLCSPTAVLPTLTGQRLAIVDSVPPGTSDIRGSAETIPKPPIMSVRRSLSDFLAICGKESLAASCDAPAPGPASQPTQSSPGVLEVLPTSPKDTVRSTETPTELIDNGTLTLPAHYVSPIVRQRYMASLELGQKRALVRALASLCAVELVEREHLGPDAEDVHLILDCDTAVLFVPVESLPRRADTLVASLTHLSWRFSRLLVVFECYPSTWNFRSDTDYADKHVASVWSPPVVKAVKKVRRDVAIADGVRTKCASAAVQYAFANTTEEAAAFVRMYGDVSALAQNPEAGGSFLAERQWLTEDERDGEYDLCGVDGMNLFAASLLLSQTTLEDFLEMSPDERLLEYAELVGIERMTRFNVEMARRLEAMQLPPSSPIDLDISSSSRDVGNSEFDIY